MFILVCIYVDFKLKVSQLEDFKVSLYRAAIGNIKAFIVSAVQDGGELTITWSWSLSIEFKH